MRLSKLTHQHVVDTLAARGRRYEIQVSASESRVIDYGIFNGRNAWTPTRFVFDRDGVFVFTNRPWKARWLTRGQ